MRGTVGGEFEDCVVVRSGRHLIEACPPKNGIAMLVVDGFLYPLRADEATALAEPWAPVLEVPPPKVTGETSDGYHTFNELYDHRITLWIALCRFAGGAWRSRLHSDGASFDGWFVLGLGRARGEQMTYHLPVSRWDETGFAETLERGPEFDGHSPADVLRRIAALATQKGGE